MFTILLAYLHSHILLSLPLGMLNPFFTANWWDWQPHRKLGAKFLVILCAGSTLLLVQSKALDEAPYKLSGAVAKLAGITFWSLAFSYWFDKPWFHNWRNTCCYAHHTFLLGFPTGVILCHHASSLCFTLTSSSHLIHILEEMMYQKYWIRLTSWRFMKLKNTQK
jgi:hypothetical protein